MDRIKNVGVILAGGSGERLGSEIPKQFLELKGKKVIEYSIEAFESHPMIDELLIITKKEYYDIVNSIIEKNRYKKIAAVLPGGKERYLSSLSAISYYTQGEQILLFHDAVRPLLSKRIIDDCLEAIVHYDAVNVAIKVADTIIQVDDNNNMISAPKRDFIRHGQSPQCFKKSVIKEAYRLALNDPAFTTTDDCSTVLKYLPKTPICVIEGEIKNMKITYKDDLRLLTALMG